jgi:uncharacterized protein YegP (UPF0339 family)
MKNPLDFFHPDNYRKMNDEKNLNNPTLWGKYILIAYETIYLKHLSNFDHFLHDLLLINFEINNKNNFKYVFSINKTNFTIIYDSNQLYGNEYNAFKSIPNIKNIEDIEKNIKDIKNIDIKLSVLDINKLFNKIKIINLTKNDPIIDDVGKIFFFLRKELKNTFSIQEISYYAVLIVALLLFQISSSSYNLDASLNIKTKDNETKKVFLYSFSEAFNADLFDFNITEYDNKPVEHIFLDYNASQDEQNLHMGRVFAALKGNENVVKMNVQKKDGETSRIDLLVEI